MRVLWALCCCFRLVTRLLPRMTYGKTNPNAIFGSYFIRSRAPIFGWGRPDSDIRKWKPEKSPVSDLPGTGYSIAIRKRSFSDPETMLIHECFSAKLRFLKVRRLDEDLYSRNASMLVRENLPHVTCLRTREPAW